MAFVRADILYQIRLTGCAHTTGGRTLGPRPPLVPVSKHLQGKHDQKTHGRKHRAVFTPPPGLQGAAAAYNSRHGLPEPLSIDYANVKVDPSRGNRIARSYARLPSSDPAAKDSYRAMRDEVNVQFDYLTKDLGIRFSPTARDPYPDVSSMVADLRDNSRLKVLKTSSTGGHPYFSDRDNDKFRFVHDAFGHAATGRGFDRHGEEAAWLSHSQMFSPLARQAMTTETRGQNSALIFTRQGFPEQKVALLPEEFVRPPSDVPMMLAKALSSALASALAPAMAPATAPVSKHSPGGHSHDQSLHGRRRRWHALVNLGSPDANLRVENLSSSERRIVEELYGGRHGPDGILAVPRVVEPTFSGRRILGLFLDPSDPDPDRPASVLGQFDRRIERQTSWGSLRPGTRPRETVAKHDYLFLDPDVQGQGIGRSFFRQAERAYREHDVDAIELSAGLGVGGYAWARHGFDWKPTYAGQRFMDPSVNTRLLKESGRFPRVDPPSGPWRDRDRQLARDWAQTNMPPPLPIEIANLGRDGPVNSQGHHLGKAVLLGSSWDGRKKVRRRQ